MHTMQLSYTSCLVHLACLPNVCCTAPTDAAARLQCCQVRIKQKPARLAASRARTSPQQQAAYAGTRHLRCMLRTCCWALHVAFSRSGMLASWAAAALQLRR
jgi:hypothetical protein